MCPPLQWAQQATPGQRGKLEWASGGCVWDRQRLPCFGLVCSGPRVCDKDILRCLVKPSSSF